MSTYQIKSEAWSPSVYFIPYIVVFIVIDRLFKFSQLKLQLYHKTITLHLYKKKTLLATILTSIKTMINEWVNKEFEIFNW